MIGKGDTIVRFCESKNLKKSNFSENKTGIKDNKMIDEKIIEKCNENNSENNSFMKCNEFKSEGDAFSGFCTLPSNMLNIKNTEICRILKLTVDSVVPVTFIVPRSDDIKGYFHDDLYRNVRSRYSSYNASDWIDFDLNNINDNGGDIDEIENNDSNNHKNSGNDNNNDLNNISHGIDNNPLPQGPVPHLYSFPPIYETLKPANMTNSSEKIYDPLDEEKSQKLKSKISLFKNEICVKEAKDKVRNGKFERLQKLALQSSMHNKNQTKNFISSALSSSYGGNNLDMSCDDLIRIKCEIDANRGTKIPCVGTKISNVGTSISSVGTKIPCGDMFRPAGSSEMPRSVPTKVSSRRGRDATPIYDDTDSDDEERWN